MKNNKFKWIIFMIVATVTLLGFAHLIAGYFNATSTNMANSPSSRPIMKKFTNSIGMRLVYLPGGSFKMGDGLSRDQPVHDVTISSFWIGQYEVTNAEYDLFRKRPKQPVLLTAKHPAMFLSWYEANDFCRWLSKKERRKYRLPTEAEWEYAARGGLSQKTYPWGNEDPETRATLGMVNPTPVGSYLPNGFGLYDMAGNINEWVSDWYAEDYYVKSPTQDPQGPPSGQLRITRGGLFSAFDVTCATRYAQPPDLTKGPPPTADNLPGFRIALDAPENISN